MGRSTIIVVCGNEQLHDGGKIAMEEEYENGNALVRKGLYEMALVKYEKALELISSSEKNDELDSLRLKLYLNLAHCHLKLRNYEVVRDYCNECLRLDCHNIKGFLRRALALEGMGNFQESLEDLSAALALNPPPSLLHEIIQIQTRLRHSNIMDLKALKEETVPVSYVTSNQSLRFNFGGVYPNEIFDNTPFRIRLNITNEFGLWNRLHLSSSTDSDHHSVSVEVVLIPMSSTARELSLIVHSNPHIGINGRVELTLSLTRQTPTSTLTSPSISPSEPIPFILKFSSSNSLPSGLPIHPILTLPLLFKDSIDQSPPVQLTPLLDIASQLNANGIRIQTIQCQSLSHEVYALESPGSLGIGGKVWDATYVILDYLQTVPELLFQRNVIELGSGTGLVGLSLRYFDPSRVVLTDVSAVVPLLQANILLNQLLSQQDPSSSSSTSYEAVTHFWGTPLDPSMVMTTKTTVATVATVTTTTSCNSDIPSNSDATAPCSSQPAIVVASDVIYDPAGFEPLLKTFQSLLLPSSSLPAVADRVVLAHRHRNPEDHHFFSMLTSSESGLLATEINLSHIFEKYHEGDQSLRDVKIFHVTKRSTDSSPSSSSSSSSS